MSIQAAGPGMRWVLPTFLFAVTLVFPQTAGATDQSQGSDQSGNVASNEPPFSRWLNLSQLSFSGRYRETKDDDGVQLFNFAQERTMAEGNLKLDNKAKYQVHFRVSSGKFFNWSYVDLNGGGFTKAIPKLLSNQTAEDKADVAATEALLPNALSSLETFKNTGAQIFARQLYFSATPVSALTFEVGSLGIERGANSEITSFDEDGWITGERVRLHLPRILQIDEVSVTYGYLGNLFNPNSFTRMSDLGKSNYHQFMVQKAFGKRLKTSVDYTHFEYSRSWRAGILVSTKESKIVDRVRLEGYDRTNAIILNNLGYGASPGYAVTLFKGIKKVDVQLGYASIDVDYAVYGADPLLHFIGHTLNGDAYGTGARIFTRLEYRVAKNFNLFGFYTHEIGTVPHAPDDTSFGLNQRGLNVGFLFDARPFVSRWVGVTRN